MYLPLQIESPQGKAARSDSVEKAASNYDAAFFIQFLMLCNAS